MAPAPKASRSGVFLILACLLAAQGPVSATRRLAQDWQAAANSLGAAASSFSKALQSSTGTSAAAASQQQQAAAAAAPGGYQQQQAAPVSQGDTTTATWSGEGQQAQAQQANTGAASGQVPKAVLVDLAPGASVGLTNQNGYPKLSANTPGTGVVVAQGPGQSNPDVSFQLGPNDAPVKVTLGRQSALSGGVDSSAEAGSPASDESGLSGSLDLGHYGVSQSNAFESLAVNTDGAEFITPFAKLQVPVKAFTSVGQGFQQVPAQLAQLAKAFQVQSASAPAPQPELPAAGNAAPGALQAAP